MITATINIGLKKGVLDDQGKATHHALDTLGFKDITKDVRIGKQIIIQLDTDDKDEALEKATLMCTKLLANTVIQDYQILLDV